MKISDVTLMPRHKTIFEPAIFISLPGSKLQPSTDTRGLLFLESCLFLHKFPLALFWRQKLLQQSGVVLRSASSHTYIWYSKSCRKSEQLMLNVYVHSHAPGKRRALKKPVCSLWSKNTAASWGRNIRTRAEVALKKLLALVWLRSFTH